MEGDPLTLIEGMTIAGFAVGATQGYIYLRVEYPHAFQVLNAAIAAAREAGLPRRRRAWQRQAASTSKCGSAPAPTSAAKRPRCSRASRASAAKSACARRCRPIKGLFGAAHRRQQRHHARERPDDPRRRRGSSTGTSARASRAARCRSSSPATSSAAGSSSAPSASRLRELLYDYGGGSATGRPIRAVQIGGPLGAYLPASQFDVAARLRGPVGDRRAARPRRRRRVRRHRRHGARWRATRWSSARSSPAANARPAASARSAAWRSWTAIGRGEDRNGSSCWSKTCARRCCRASLCGLGGMTPFPVQSALKHFPEDFRPRTRGGYDVLPSTIKDLGTPPASRPTPVTVEIDGATGHRAGGHLGHACGGARRRPGPEALRHRHAEGLRLLPPVPRRDRRPQGLPRLLHDHGRAGHEDQHAVAQAHAAAPRRHRSLRLRSPARVRRLPGERALRAAGHAAEVRHHATPR